MASIFLSYSWDDKELAMRLAEALEALGHALRWDVTAVNPGDDWRRVLMDELQSCDAMLALISGNSLNSQFVFSEIGSARVFSHSRGLVLFPVIVGDLAEPQVIQDLQAVHLADGAAANVGAAAESIHRGIVRQMERLRATYPRIFISHRYRDEAVVRALVELLETAFRIEPADLRCTSIDPYRLPAGVRTQERLRTEISRARVVLGVLTPAVKESSYVMFELGASWGQKVPTLPLLARGMTLGEIPAPMNDLNYLKLFEPADCQRLIGDLARLAGLPRKEGVEAAVARRIETLVEKSRDGAEEKLRELLANPDYKKGRYLATLAGKARLSESQCLSALRKLNAREVPLENGKVVWRLD